MLINLSVELGVSQKVLEEEYYMVDLFDLMKQKRKKEARSRLNLLTIIHSKQMEEQDFKKFVHSLSTEAGMQEKQEFDRDRFEQLREMI
ncbi:hypothetical protein SAMN05444416_11287 [Thermoactinomyces sp. DSM 45892]|nr:hypothetical protein SAMN05444416_11287 [Thermoactinomyces sp. DSM 45892]